MKSKGAWSIMRYEGRIFRPPSEAYSLIVQSSVGCSHNRCAFCSMYKEKTFHLRPLGQVLEDLELARAQYAHVEKIFIADGDALVRAFSDWEQILAKIATLFPECRSVTSYASPKSVATKTDAQLRAMGAQGLAMVYVGLESGCDAVLARMDKGENARGIIDACLRLKAAGIRLSVTAISGLGGRALMHEHAEETACALSEIRPDYIGLLTLMVEEGTPLMQWCREGRFEVLSAREVMEEELMLLERIDAEGAVFRANHASNYLPLRGTLNRDRAALTALLRDALGDRVALRPEAWRGL